MVNKYILLVIFLSRSKCHVPKNDSEVIVTYERHAESDTEKKILIDNDHEIMTTKKFGLEAIDSLENKHNERGMVKEKDETVFIPNERAMQDNENEYLNANEKTISDIFNPGNTLDDLISGKGRILVETEPPPNKDVVFVQGKNNDDVVEEKKVSHKGDSTKKSTKKMVVHKVENCTHLDCRNNLAPVCGGKMEHNKWKYRLFLNECFFNKVNCAFNYEVNKYQQVSREKCTKVGAHYSERPFSFKPSPLPSPKKETLEQNLETRKSFSSRRSTNINLNGEFCSHACPVSCPEDYDPQCAVSSTGQRRVFMNHCKLDYNSCAYRVFWHRRPLGECVGNQKAELRQNRAFIGWMQKIGIIDSKGRFVRE